VKQDPLECGCTSFPSNEGATSRF